MANDGSSTGKAAKKSLNDSIVTAPQSLIDDCRAAADNTPLRDLADKHLVEIYHRLKLRHTVTSIRDRIQKDWVVHAERHPKSVERGIRMFKRKILGDLEQYPERARDKPRSQLEAERKRDLTRARSHKRKLDVLVELSTLFQKQEDRVNKWIELEEESGHPIPQAGHDVRLLKDILVDALKCMKELGVIDRQPTPQVIEHHHVFKDITSGMRDGGSRFKDAAHQLLQTTESKVKILEIDDETGEVTERERTQKDIVRSHRLGRCGGVGLLTDGGVGEAEPVREGISGVIDLNVSGKGDREQEGSSGRGVEGVAAERDDGRGAPR